MSRSLRSEFKSGMSKDHKRWGIYQQYSDRPDASLVYEQFGTRVKLAGVRVNKPASTPYKVPTYKITSLM